MRANISLFCVFSLLISSCSSLSPRPPCREPAAAAEDTREPVPFDFNSLAGQFQKMSKSLDRLGLSWSEPSNGEWASLTASYSGTVIGDIYVSPSIAERFSPGSGRKYRYFVVSTVYVDTFFQGSGLGLLLYLTAARKLHKELQVTLRTGLSESTPALDVWERIRQMRITKELPNCGAVLTPPALEILPEKIGSSAFENLDLFYNEHRK
jgi:hypothetical protein